MAAQTNMGLKKMSPETAAVFKGTDFAPGGKSTVVEYGFNPFHTPPRTPPVDKECLTPSEYGWSDDGSTLKSTSKSFAKKTAGAYEGADMKWQPCMYRQLPRHIIVEDTFVLTVAVVTIQPFREEVSRIIATYIADGAPRQLNLSSKERTALLRALANTTHPSAFRDVAGTVEWSLRHQAHPNFIRWTICNGNRPRVIFARGLGVGGIVAGIITAVLIILSNAGRGWRVLSAIGLVIGIATLIAAWKGMCVVSKNQKASMNLQVH